MNNNRKLKMLFASLGYTGLTYYMFTNSQAIFDYKILKNLVGKGKLDFSDTFIGTCFYNLIHPQTEKEMLLTVGLGLYSIPKFVGSYGLTKFFMVCFGSYIFTMISNLPSNSFAYYQRSFNDYNNPDVLTIPLSLIYIMSNNNLISPLWSLALVVIIVLNALGKIEFDYDLRAVLCMSFFRKFFYKRSASYLRKNLRNIKIKKWKML